MPGGVGGVAPRGVPLSRSLPQSGNSGRRVHIILDRNGFSYGCAVNWRDQPGLDREAMAIDVAEWLHGLGLGEYAFSFADNHIDADVLQRLTADDLRDLGIASVGHRRRLLDAIAILSEHPPPRTETAA